MTLRQYVDSIKEKRIAVLGIGVSNTPLLELLLSHGCDVTACDQRRLEQLGEQGRALLEQGAKLKLGADYLEGLDQDLIFRTPGLMPFDPHLEAARARGSVLTSEMEVFFSLCPCRSIAVTGSDGKTTTTTIISELLKAAGYRVHLGGNIGHPLLCEVPEIRPEDIAVLELSSFQLHSMACRPDIAVITNVSPNHLDKHKDFQDYIDAKRAIFALQGPEQRLVLNLDDPHTPYYREQAGASLSYFTDRGSVEDGAMVENGRIFTVRAGKRREIMSVEEIRLPGEHNLLNILAAFAAVRDLADAESCRRVARDFAGVAHRLEHVRELHGVLYINDSIGSSPTRTIAGLHALNTRCILIAGGYDKHIPFDELGEEICSYTKLVLLTGDTAPKIRAAIEAARGNDGRMPELLDAEDLAEAVRLAAQRAQPGDTVLLSPACASFDRYKNFEERGNAFKKYVMELS